MDEARIREEARRISTEHLLDRVTVYRGEMEGPALDILQAELNARGVGHGEVEAHAAQRERAGLLRRPDGTVVCCTYCPRPATEQRQQWYRLWGWFLPLFPRSVYLCREHDEQLPTDVHGRTLHYDAGQGECRDGPAG
jgi:hypothetical protein